MTNIIIKGVKYKLPRGWHLMTPDWLSRLSGIPLSELTQPKEDEKK